MCGAEAGARDREDVSRKRVKVCAAPVPVPGMGKMCYDVCQGGCSARAGARDREDVSRKRVKALCFANPRVLFNYMKVAFKQGTNVEFSGCYEIPADPQISYQDCVKFIVEEIWKMTGYRWTVINHQDFVDDISSKYYYCQDAAHMKKPKKKKGLKPGCKPRDNSGMDRFSCGSHLHVCPRHVPNVGLEV
ncbi:hypothetical protein M422DRAFT_40827 [Sphaerobolus stellatus SS14]|nr:hypothetical protein M422DRAFT_40827 [Sphaerobolus stellatus SS14]